jgi:endonuclease YncB( thermonuclease family)
MLKIFPLRRQRRNQTRIRRHPWRSSPDCPSWHSSARAEWRRLAKATIAVAALFATIIAVHAAVYPNRLISESLAASGAFRLCAEGRQANCVVDGDTIWHGGVKIRLADIDTPEIYSPKCPLEAALGRRATERLRELLNAGPFEVVPGGSRDVDRYGRKLRIVERHGHSLGDILIAEGLARRWDGARRSWCG